LYIRLMYNAPRWRGAGDTPASQRSAPNGDKQDQPHTGRGRFNARISEEQRDLIERAAALTGQSVSHFIVSSAQRAAEQTIREHDIIVLSARDAAAVMEALLHPAPVNDALRRAFARHRELIGEA
jgi:uncharacterized protein (DUF1778 family)